MASTIPWHEWLNLLLRWFHLVAGIMWIGSSFYFIWLDSHLEAPEPKNDKIEGSLWMVHSGGFYTVEKRYIAPGEMPKTLHWFKWEATFTWISGFALLCVVYYFTGGLYLVDPQVAQINTSTAAWIGIALLAGGWFFYDALWQFLGLKAPKLATAISLGAVTGITYGLTHLFAGRAAFIHVGALFGTLMVVNVWVRILPAQQQMIDATKAGRKPDYTLGKHAKNRSVHNSYMTLPVLFIMLSNHYPMTFGHAQNWVVLLLLILLGASVRHFMISKNPASAKLALVPAAAALGAVIVMSAGPTQPLQLNTTPVSFQEVRHVINNRCVACHSSHPTDEVFKIAPNGVMFDRPETIHAMADRIKFRAVVSKTMPLVNKTGITEEEREILGRWVDQGAKTQ